MLQVACGPILVLRIFGWRNERNRWADYRMMDWGQVVNGCPEGLTTKEK